MVTLQKSIDKRNALIKATIDLVNNNGFHATPMSKIAKMAKVSPATIYLYFENKQDLGHIWKSSDNLFLFLEHAFNVVTRSEAAEKKIRSAFKAGSITKRRGQPAWDESLAKKIISQDEYRLLSEADKVRFDAILVDDFNETEYHGKA